MLARQPVTALLLTLLACETDAPPDTAGTLNIGGSAGPSLVLSLDDSETGAKIEGAWLSLAPSGRDQQTNAEGSATFAALPADSYTVTAAADGYETDTFGPFDIAAEDRSAQLSLSPAEARTLLWGTVTGPGASAPLLAGATVSVDGVSLATTGTDGSYAVTVEAGEHAVHIAPPAGSTLTERDIPLVVVGAGVSAEVSATLAGAPPDDARYVSDQECARCHSDASDQHADSAHSRAALSPADAEVDGPSGLVAAFSDGAVVSLGGGGAAALSRTGPGAWWVTVTDETGAVEGPLAVAEVYGGLRHAAALAVEGSDQLRVAPIAWSVAAGDVVPAWEAGWQSTAAPSTSSWDLQCAGCHATGHRLTEPQEGQFVLAARTADDVWSRTIGCQACHGPGSAHASSRDAAHIVHVGRLDPARRRDTCARCHGRTAPLAHPFSAQPAWPVTDGGSALAAGEALAAHAAWDRVPWLGTDASRLHRDQSGELEVSAHTGDYVGACGDCHAPHGSAHDAALRADRDDPTLCTGCHATRFPDEATNARHDAHHSDPAQGCVDCHFPRAGLLLGPDSRSGAGEVRAHLIVPWAPDAALEEFAAAGTSTLARGEAPIPACLDCHWNTSGCSGCLRGDPTLQSTFESHQRNYETFLKGME